MTCFCLAFGSDDIGVACMGYSARGGKVGRFDDLCFVSLCIP